MAAILSEYANRLANARTLLNLVKESPAGLQRYCPTIIDVLGRMLPPQRIQLAVETGGLPRYAAEALARASQAAVSTWNNTLQGIAEIEVGPYTQTTDILVTGVHGPLFGIHHGQAIFSEVMRPRFRLAQFATVQIVLAGRSPLELLCTSPMELYTIACHEIGHCFGLGESPDPGSLMAPQEAWSAEAPSGPFLDERQCILGWLLECHSLLAEAYQLVGDTAAAARHEGYLGELGRAATCIPYWQSCGYETLVERCYAPAPIRRYWEAVRLVRLGRLETALWQFESALQVGPPLPEILLRRAYVRLWLGDRGGVDDIRAVVESHPTWIEARECLTDVLASNGMEREAEWHRAVLRRMVSAARVRGLLWRTRYTLFKGRRIPQLTAEVARYAVFTGAVGVQRVMGRSERERPMTGKP